MKLPRPFFILTLFISLPMITEAENVMTSDAGAFGYWACLDTMEIVTNVNESICMGEAYEGYTQAGTYVDTFMLDNGDDSIRVLYLRLLDCDSLVVYTLDACSAYMSNGSNMDYSEFVPYYPVNSTCAAVSAGNLFRSEPQENKHSCTPGLNGTSAMCVSAMGSCTPIPGHEASVLIEVTLTPEPASIFQVTGLQLYEKAPPVYDWIDGGSGPNNYPTLFGLRIFKNGTEVYSNPAIPTSATWALKEFDFTDNTLFEISEPSVFRFEFLPYCPVGNGATVAAWDLEDIIILGGCVRLPSDPIITGLVLTKKGTPVTGTEMHFSNAYDFQPYLATPVDPSGTYTFQELEAGSPVFFKGFHNTDILNGVSTLDLIAIQKHLLGKETFASLDQYVAADINHDGIINVRDLIALRKTILGYTSYFEGNTSWRFGLWPQSLNGVDPTSFKELAFYESLQGDTIEADFLGVKIGDLNGDVSFTNDNAAPKNTAQTAYRLAIPDEDILPDIPFSIDVIATADILAEGIQLALQMKGLTLAGVEGNAFMITDDHLSVLENGLLRLSWASDGPVDIVQGDVLFSLNFIARQATTLSQAIREANDALACEIYTPDETLPIKLRIDPFSEEDKGESIGYFAIAPNPFGEEVHLKILVLHDTDVILNICDASGKEVFVREDHFATGEHDIVVTADDLRHASGILFCRMISGGDSIARKMVRVE